MSERRSKEGAELERRRELLRCSLSSDGGLPAGVRSRRQGAAPGVRAHRRGEPARAGRPLPRGTLALFGNLVSAGTASPALTTLVSAGEKGMAFFKQFTKLAHQNVLTGTEAEADDWVATAYAVVIRESRQQAYARVRACDARVAGQRL